MSHKELDQVSMSEYVEGVRGAIRQRAKFFAFVYDEIRKQYGKEKASEITSKAAYTLGVERGKNSLKAKPELSKGKLSDWTDRTRKQLVIFDSRVPKEGIIQMYDCPLVDAWKELGKSTDEIRALCDAAVASDQGEVSILPFTLQVTHRIGTGEPYCEQVYQKKI